MPRWRTAAALAASCALAPAQTDWQRLPLLEHVRYPAFAFDSLRGTAVLFGGDTEVGVQDATWIWDRAGWQRAAPAHRPTARQQAGMVFDAARGVALLFGGLDAGNNRLADTWQYDGLDWTLLAPAQSPSARSLHAMVFDATRATVLLFGGRSPTFAELADTWEWNGTTWSQRNPVHQPPGRSGAALACDAGRQRVVMFGGSCFQLGPCWRGDTWEWDGVDWTDCTQPYPTPAPAPRWSHGMTYDPGRARTVLFGGSDEPNHYQDDTWEWDGSNWVEVLPAARPIGRLGFGAGFDPATQRTLVFGGESWAGLVSDLWSFDGLAWQVAELPMQPATTIIEYTEAIAFDGERGVVVLFGNMPMQSPVQQTWEWDGSRWWQRHPGQGPPRPEHHRLQWLPSRHRVVLYQPQRPAATSDQTWDYDGAQWTQLSPVHQPGVGSGCDLAQDPRLDRLLLFGGRDTQGLRGSTWTFDGVDWQQVGSTGPSPREGHAMALDLRRGRVVLFGGDDGSARLGDTFEWDGQQWLQRQPANAPPARRGHAMTYDLARQRIVLHGGISATANLDDTWEWDGVDWQQRQTATSRRGFTHGLAHDFWRQETIAIGGYVSGTWRYAPTMPGTFASFGRGCGGSAGAPVVWTALGERPYSGGPFTARFSNLPGTLAFAAVGFSSTSWGGVPLPWNLQAIGYPRCDLLVEPAAVVPLPIAAGAAAWTLSLPAAPSVVGLPFFQQALALDPSGPDGLAMTPGAAGVVGGR